MTVVTPCGPAVCLVSLANLHSNGARWVVGRLHLQRRGQRLAETGWVWVYHDTRSRHPLRVRRIIMAATIDEVLETLPRTGPDVVGGPPTMVLRSPRPCLPRVPRLGDPLGGEMGLPSHGQATVWETSVGLDCAREGAGWCQQLRQWWEARREAHRRATLAPPSTTAGIPSARSIPAPARRGSP